MNVVKTKKKTVELVTPLGKFQFLPETLLKVKVEGKEKILPAEEIYNLVKQGKIYNWNLKSIGKKI